MGIKDRVAQSHKNKNRVRDIQELKFIQNTEIDNLQTLSLEQLEHRFDEIGQQAQLLQGRILLEARGRFTNERSFGAWCAKSPYLMSMHQTTRTRLINLAKFFSDRELDKISVTAAYEISAPINSDVAVEVYEFAKGKNLPIAEVKRQIALKKGLANTPLNPVDDVPFVKHEPVIEQIEEATVFNVIPPPAVSQVLLTPAIVSSDVESEIKAKVISDVSGVSAIVGIRLLQDCVKELQSRMYK
jgi:hypothetical protein